MRSRLIRLRWPVRSEDGKNAGKIDPSQERGRPWEIYERLHPFSQMLAYISPRTHSSLVQVNNRLAVIANRYAALSPGT